MAEKNQSKINNDVLYIFLFVLELIKKKRELRVKRAQKVEKNIKQNKGIKTE